MSIRVSAIDLRALQFVEAEDLRAAAIMVLRMQRQRIERGQGSSGRPMVYHGSPRVGVYSKQHGEKRQASGRDVNKRTLTYTSAMLKARQIKEVTKTRAVIGWTDAVQILKALGNQRRHPFTGPTPDELKKATEFLKQRARERLKKTQARARAMKGRR